MTEYKTREQKAGFYKSNVWRGKDGLRQQALKRDNNECVMCKAEGGVTVAKKDDEEVVTLEVDHIKEIELYPELAEELDNLQTLCRLHHNKKHKRFGGRRKENRWQDEKW